MKKFEQIEQDIHDARLRRSVGVAVGGLVGFGAVVVWLTLRISRGGDAATTLAGLAVIVATAGAVACAAFGALALLPLRRGRLPEHTPAEDGDTGAKAIVVTLSLPGLSRQDLAAGITVNLRFGTGHATLGDVDSLNGKLAVDALSEAPAAPVPAQLKSPSRWRCFRPIPKSR